ncbi:MAG: hypothetical protein KME47_13980 [Nodosilinea sp. WJT8-NPBG4]|jgi:cysteine synthase A|nr:hypothetical protein [Nodosilinea sp. WJT8-NPBG4]
MLLLAIEDATVGGHIFACEDGLLLGISTGVAVKAQLDVGRRPENEGKLIMITQHSFGERYLSTLLF